jgi:hypothetical protein
MYLDVVQIKIDKIFNLKFNLKINPIKVHL